MMTTSIIEMAEFMKDSFTSYSIDTERQEIITDTMYYLSLEVSRLVKVYLGFNKDTTESRLAEYVRFRVVTIAELMSRSDFEFSKIKSYVQDLIDLQVVVKFEMMNELHWLFNPGVTMDVR